MITLTPESFFFYFFFHVPNLLHYVVHVEKKLHSIKITFPIRRHLYLECDIDFGLINQKSRAEVPGDWVEVFKSGRVKPMLFEVVEVEQSFFRNWTSFFEKRYRRKCPFPIRPIRELKILKEHPGLIFYRNTFKGVWQSSPVIDKKFKPNRKCKDGEFELPDYLYNKVLPISQPKWENLQDLKKFCGPETQKYFENIQYSKN
ncbi:hypothetical protein ABEB36_004648 [Hypothenemus hampei]|uniref:Uncharacterized protein n=1 Tax=Hypothenemus hampei TaxID=57062 RepID=A0ABD1F410_HYPHA